MSPFSRSARRLVAALLWLLLAGALAIPTALRAQASARYGTCDLTLADFLRQVQERNDSLQAKLLEMEATRRLAKAEYGTFEPQLFGSVTGERNSRENTVEQARNTFSQFFQERNNIYQGGIESLVPSGARVRLGYTLRDIENNLQSQPVFGSRGATNGEFQTFFGASITQPLLKNAGTVATLAGIRIAALASDIAFQEYRRQFMLVIGTAEAAYWNLYMAQEQERFFLDSVATAGKILADSRARVEAGKASELDVLEAESGLALRRTKLAEAEQRRYEAADRVLSYYSETVLATNRLVHAVDRPAVNGAPPRFFDAWRAAMESNPDYLAQREKVIQEQVRLGYARNQRLPELNFIGSYGLNGLGDSPGSSLDDVSQADFPSWSIGVELRIPMAGGIKTANELAAARLRERQSLVSLRELEIQIVNGLDTATHKLDSARGSVTNYQTVVRYNQSLLDSGLARFEVGRLDSRRVLEFEGDLLEARSAEVESLVQFQRARIELALLQGTLLKERKLELTPEELDSVTRQIARRGGISDERYAIFLRDLQAEYERKDTPPPPYGTPTQDRARRALEDKMAEWPATNAASTTSSGAHK